MVAIAACHNRRDLSVRCMRSLFAGVPTDVDLSVVAVDDGSTDGTAEALASLDLPITVVAGDGTWFWPRSMAEAERVAEVTDPDWVLWLNDDVDLDPDALMQWRAASRLRPDAIWVGAMWCPSLERVGYAGFSWPNRASLSRTRLRTPSGTPRQVEGFHGNFVAVPRSARRAIGPIDGDWPQYYADLDYALRAETLGVEIWLLPRVVGNCDPSPTPWQDRRLPPHRRLRAVFGRKGWPVRAHWRFHRRHACGLWPILAWQPHWRALVGPKRRRSGNRPQV